MCHGNEDRAGAQRAEGKDRWSRTQAQGWWKKKRANPRRERCFVCLVLLLMKREGLNEEGGWEVFEQFHAQGWEMFFPAAKCLGFILVWSVAHHLGNSRCFNLPTPPTPREVYKWDIGLVWADLQESKAGFGASWWTLLLHIIVVSHIPAHPRPCWDVKL